MSEIRGNVAEPPQASEPRRTRYLPQSARARTLLLGGTLTAVLLLLATTVPVPFVALGPGSTFNTIAAGQDDQAVITFSGEEIPPAAVEKPTGHLNMLTIRVVDQVPLIEAAVMWASGTYQFAPRDEYYPPDKSKEQITEANVQMFKDSQSAAEIEALRYLGYPNIVFVGSIEKGSPSWGLLRPDDQIVAVNGRPVSDYPSLKTAMTSTRPGDKVAVTVLRAGSRMTESVVLGANSKEGPQGFLGVGVAERPTAPFSIHISLEDIGGPSAGLMFTLGIIDRLTPGDMTGGKFIAGTGTMGLDGNVGAIGGITFKEVTARAAGADYMLVPAENCAEARTAIPDGLTLVKVHTLTDALSAVSMISKGGTPPGC
ncbi:MAG: PDZ domain-containing protein [Nakamurella sp.]